MSQHLSLKSGKLGNIILVLRPADIGMFTQRAGRRAGGIQKNGVEKLFRLVLQHIGFNGFGVKTKPVEIFPEAAKTIAGLVQGSHLRAGKRELGSLAARSCTEIGNTFSGNIAHQLHRHAGREILNPPGTLGKAFKRGNLAFKFTETDTAIRQNRTAQLFRPDSRILLHREIDGRGRQLRFGNPFGNLISVS
ncbi:hypothetical protein D3C87_1447160 [compost metagenome]